jgi:hypothetical protein
MHKSNLVGSLLLSSVVAAAVEAAMAGLAMMIMSHLVLLEQ